MKERNENNDKVRDYLLGKLDEEERQQLEEKFFTDKDFHESIRMTEDELLDDYVFQTLPPHDAEQFRDRMLCTPEQIKRWATIEELKKYAGRERRPTPRKFSIPLLSGLSLTSQITLAVTLLLIGTVGLWLYRLNSLQREVASLNGSEESTKIGSDFSIELPSVRVRSDQTSNVPQIAIPAEFAVAQIRVPLESSSYEAYETTLVKQPDSVLFTLNRHAIVNSPSGRVLVVRVPVRALAPGEYRLIVKGTTTGEASENVGSYLFQILSPSTP